MYKMYKSMFGSIVFYPCDQILFIARTVSSPQNEWAKCGIAQAEIELWLVTGGHPQFVLALEV